MKSLRAECICDIGLGMDVFWKRKDLILLAPGSLPCIRELYLRAGKLGTLGRFRYVSLRNEDYILGSAEDKIRQEVRNASEIPGVSVIVIYLSCLDILIRLDFADLEKTLSEETGCTVRCFFRGPLARTDEITHPGAEEVLKSLPPERSCAAGAPPLPPPAADIAGISDCIRNERTANILLTPAGCRSCMRDGDMAWDQKNVYYSEPKRSDYIFGWEDTAAEDVSRFIGDADYQASALIKTAVPSFLGFDGDAVREAVKEKHKECLLFPSDGFHDAVYGAGTAQLTLVRSAVSHSGDENSIWILGYTELLCGMKNQFAEFLSFFKELGLTVKFPGEDRRRGRPALAWAVSSAGLPAGTWLHEQLGVPLLTAAPVGVHAVNMWKQNVQALLAAGQGVRSLKIHNPDIPARHEERVLFIGDPVQMMGVAHAFWHEGFKRLSIAGYAWSKETEAIYRMAPGAERMLWFQTRRQLETAWEKADLAVCDPVWLDAMGKKPCLPLPWGFFSGREAIRPEHGILGQAFLKRLCRFWQEKGWDAQ